MLSIQIRCFKDLVRYGAEQVLEREYGPYIIAPEPGYDFSVMIDLEDLPAEKGRSLIQALLAARLGSVSLMVSI